MPHDRSRVKQTEVLECKRRSAGRRNEDEVVSFGRYFARELHRVGIPWTMNVLDVYYNTKKSYWRSKYLQCNSRHGQGVGRNSKGYVSLIQ